MTAKKSGSSPNKRRKYDEAFKAEAQRLASENRRTQAAAVRHQTQAAEPLAAGPIGGRSEQRGSGTRPGEARFAGSQQAPGTGTRHFKKALVVFDHPTPRVPTLHRPAAGPCAPLVCAPHHGLGPSCARRPQTLARPAGPHDP